MVGENIWNDDDGRSWDGFYDDLWYDKLWEMMRWEMTSYHLILPSLLLLLLFPHLSFHFHLKKERWIFKWDEIRLTWEREIDYIIFHQWDDGWLVGWLMIFFLSSFYHLIYIFLYFLPSLSFSLSLYIWDGWSSWDGWLIIVKNCEKYEMMMNFSFLSHHLFPYPSYHKIDLHLFFFIIFFFLCKPSTTTRKEEEFLPPPLPLLPKEELWWWLMRWKWWSTSSSLLCYFFFFILFTSFIFTISQPLFTLAIKDNRTGFTIPVWMNYYIWFVYFHNLDVIFFQLPLTLCSQCLKWDEWKMTKI